MWGSSAGPQVASDRGRARTAVDGWVRSDGRVAEGAGLLNLYRGNSIEGSNPSRSATDNPLRTMLRPLLTAPLPDSGPGPSSFDRSARKRASRSESWYNPPNFGG